jgi:hypothetical protein
LDKPNRRGLSTAPPLEAKMDMMNGSGDSAEADAKIASDTSPPRQEKARAKAKAKKPPPKRNTQSTIAFPYRDLDTGISVALAIMGAGGVALTTDQLAGVMNLTAGSGNFVIKTATARMFGLVTYAGGKYELTNLGFDIVDKEERRQRKARAEAFLTVPLYKRVYEEFKGKSLPPRPLGLEQAFIRFGVSPKQKDTARLVFDKSAGQAGFFVNGPDRLIEPIVAGLPRQSVYVDENDVFDEPEKGSGGAAKSPFEGLGRHPFIQGLLETLPEPKTNWTVEGRAKWLQAAARCFDLIYLGSGEIHVTAKADPTTKE